MITFQEAVAELEKGNKVTRKSWDQSNAKVCIGMQFPDENSFMTEPYMYQEINGTHRSPMELTWGLVTATDWYVLDMTDEEIASLIKDGELELVEEINNAEPDHIGCDTAEAPVKLVTDYPEETE